MPRTVVICLLKQRVIFSNQIILQLGGTGWDGNLAIAGHQSRLFQQTALVCFCSERKDGQFTLTLA